jgi:hypothetical protein
MTLGLPKKTWCVILGLIVPIIICAFLLVGRFREQTNRAHPTMATPAPANLAAEAQINIEPKIVDKGYLIGHGRNIPRPYKIEVRGKYVLINGVRVDSVPENAPPQADPGDYEWPRELTSMPADFSNYLAKKASFLNETYGYDTARSTLIEIISKQYGVKEVDVYHDMITVEFKNGSGHIFSYPRTEPSPTEEERGEMFKSCVAEYENMLKENYLLIISGDDASIIKIMVPPPAGEAEYLQISGICNSAAEPATKLEQLRKLLVGDQDMANEILKAFNGADNSNTALEQK